VFGQDFTDDGAEIRGEREVAAFVELVIVQAGPFAVNLPALHIAAHHEHTIGVAVVGAAIAIFLGGAPELAHGHEDHILHAVAHIQMKRRNALPKILQQIGKLTL